MAPVHSLQAPAIPYPHFLRQRPGVWSFHAPPTIQCADLKGFDVYAGDLCLFGGCVACRGVQRHEDSSDHVYVYANISLDMSGTSKPKTVDYSVMLDVYWIDHSVEWYDHQLTASASVGDDTISHSWWRIHWDEHEHNKFTPDSDKTRLERTGSSRVSYSDEDPNLAFLFVKVDLELPSNYGFGLLQVMQLLKFEIERPAIATTMPPPTHTQTSPPLATTVFLPLPNGRSSAQGPLLVSVEVMGIVSMLILIMCMLLYAYERVKRLQRWEVPDERRPLLPGDQNRAEYERVTMWRQLKTQILRTSASTTEVCRPLNSG